MRYKISGRENIRNYLLGGQACVTLVNTSTQSHVTLKISKALRARGEADPPFYVYVRNSSAGNNQFEYVGTIFLHPIGIRKILFYYSTKSRLRRDHKGVLAITWLVQKLDSTKNLPSALEVWHEGTCGRCGRALTHPDSIATGWGPECSKKR